MSHNLRMLAGPVVAVAFVIGGAVALRVSDSSTTSPVVGIWRTDVDQTMQNLFEVEQAKLAPGLRSSPGDASYPVIRSEMAVKIQEECSLTYTIHADRTLDIRHSVVGDSVGTWTYSDGVFTTSTATGGGGRWNLRNGRLWATFFGGWLVLKRSDRP
jgi:hypothetical protein